MPKKRRRRDWWTRKRKRLYKRAWLRFVKRSRAAIKGAKARAAKPYIKRAVKPEPVPPPPPVTPPPARPAPIPPEPEDYPEEWDVTAEYEGSPANVPSDFSIRMESKLKGAWSEEKVRGAFWYALKHGTQGLKAWEVTGMDWYKGGEGGRLYRYDTPRALEDALAAARGIFYTLRIGGFRVARVDTRKKGQ